MGGNLRKSYYRFIILLRPSFSRADKIQWVASKVPPEDVEEFRVLLQPDAPGPDGDDKGQGEADQEIEEPDAQDPADDGGKIPGIDIPQPQSIDREGSIPGRDRNMTDIEPDAEYLSYKSGHAQEEAEGDIAYQRAGMLFHIIRQAPQPF